jgi:integrase
MIDRLNPQRDPVEDRQETKEERQARRGLNHFEFTADNVRKLPLPSTGQLVYWDIKQVGLSVLCSMSTRTYRASYVISHEKDHSDAGKTITRKIGRVGEMTVQDARKKVEAYRGIAHGGHDPVKPKPRKLTFGELATDFVTRYCKVNQRTWYQTERMLGVNCKPLWNHPVDTVSKAQIKKLCGDFASEGHPYKGANTHAIVKKMLSWAEEEGLLTTNVLAGSVVEYERRSRDRVYSDQEIKLIWAAADKLGPVEGAYTKLLLLLAPRKTALAAMRRNHLDDDMTVWTTPHELTKSKKRQRDPRKKKRVYVTPLPQLAQRILKGLPKGNSDEYPMFPGLALLNNKAGQPMFNSLGLIKRLKNNGAPGFMPHAIRHTIATWLEDQGASEWERGLVLNHSGSSVTSGYSHGFAHGLKLPLLTKWATHIEELVSPAEGVAVLR